MTKTPKTLGIYFNLEPIFIDLNRRFFNDSVKASIEWGKRRSQSHKRSIRLGSFHPTTRRITIHPCLDQAIVPHICLERIVFHEMVHEHLPAKRSCGRNLIHHRAFLQFEKSYPYLEQADRWFKANLPRLLKF